MSGEFSKFDSGDNAFAKHFSNLVYAYLNSPKTKISRLKQGRPDPLRTGQEHYCYKEVDGLPGKSLHLLPSTYDGFSANTWNTNRFAITKAEYKAEDQIMVDTGDHLTYQGSLHIVDGVGSYAIEVKEAGFTVSSSDYTVDHAAGTVTFNTTRTGTITITCFYNVNSIQYDKSDTESYCFGQKVFIDEPDSTVETIDLLDPWFEYWTNSTTPKKWTPTGNVSRSGATIEGSYCCKIDATAGSWHKIEQMVELPSAITQATLIVCARTNNKLVIGLSNDGANYSQEKLYVTVGTNPYDKYVILAVSSPVASSDKFYVQISPQYVASDTGLCYIEYAGLFKGGL